MLRHPRRTLQYPTPNPRNRSLLTPCNSGYGAPGLAPLADITVSRSGVWALGEGLPMIGKLLGRA